MAVRVTFVYDPAEPDPNDRTGVSEVEFNTMNEELMQRYGAHEIDFEKIDEAEAKPYVPGGRKKR
jgi:hypothetical protein